VTRNPTNAERRPWKLDAACQDIDPETWYDPAQTVEAKKVCAGCPVLDNCLTFALDTREPWGVWGGLDEDERRRVLNGQQPRTCESCDIPFVPRRHNRRHCDGCRKPEPVVAVPGLDKHRETITLLVGDGWSDRMIAERFGLTKPQVRYARRRWNLRSTRARGGRPGCDLAPCGTDAAYRRHLRRGEPVDESCRQASVRRDAERRAKRREVVA
jgi:WhiB family redox-sensing transcriptional regulator